MKIIIAVLLLVLALTAYGTYTKNQELFAALEKNAVLIQQNQDLMHQNQFLTQKERDLLQQIQELTQQNKTLKKLPVSVSTRGAMLGPGLVAIFTTNIKEPIAVKATFISTALGSTKVRELHLSPDSKTEIGHAEGVVLESGDTIQLENANYTPVSFTIK